MMYNGSKDLSSVYDLTGTTKVCQVVVNQSFGKFISINKTNGLTYSVLCPYVVPAALLALSLPRYSEEMYIVVADLETGKTHIASHDSKISAMRDAYINSFVYDKLYKFVKGK